ncbi:MAG: molybdenum cofactor guanylyltransferase [Chitinophagaceae bacterium]|nr:molybdenum cofactor guanylyltransferase [Chitinophagaceae bacterium]
MSCNPIANDEENRLLGVVMCGGQSSRMGTDKGLIRSGDSTWVKHAVDQLEQQGIPVVVSINQTQEIAYGNLLEQEFLVIDTIDVHGPLRGLLSVHSKYPSHDLMVMACDLPDVTKDTLTSLKSIYEDKSGEHDFIVFSNRGELEPLVGVYTSEGLSKVFKLFVAGALEKHSMKYVLENGNTFATELNPEQIKEFRNYNYKEDLSS